MEAHLKTLDLLESLVEGREGHVTQFPDQTFDALLILLRFEPLLRSWSTPTPLPEVHAIRASVQRRWRRVASYHVRTWQRQAPLEPSESEKLPLWELEKIRIDRELSKVQQGLVTLALAGADKRQKTGGGGGRPPNWNLPSAVPVDVLGQMLLLLNMDSVQSMLQTCRHLKQLFGLDPTSLPSAPARLWSMFFNREPRQWTLSEPTPPKTRRIPPAAAGDGSDEEAEEESDSDSEEAATPGVEETKEEAVKSTPVSAWDLARFFARDPLLNAGLQTYLASLLATERQRQGFARRRGRRYKDLDMFSTWPVMLAGGERWMAKPLFQRYLEVWKTFVAGRQVRLGEVWTDPAGRWRLLQRGKKIVQRLLLQEGQRRVEEVRRQLRDPTVVDGARANAKKHMAYLTGNRAWHHDGEEPKEEPTFSPGNLSWPVSVRSAVSEEWEQNPGRGTIVLLIVGTGYSPQPALRFLLHDIVVGAGFGFPTRGWFPLLVKLLRGDEEVDGWWLRVQWDETNLDSAMNLFEALSVQAKLRLKHPLHAQAFRSVLRRFLLTNQSPLLNWKTAQIEMLSKLQWEHMEYALAISELVQIELYKLLPPDKWSLETLIGVGRYLSRWYISMVAAPNEREQGIARVVGQTGLGVDNPFVALAMVQREAVQLLLDTCGKTVEQLVVLVRQADMVEREEELYEWFTLDNLNRLRDWMSRSSTTEQTSGRLLDWRERLWDRTGELLRTPATDQAFQVWRELGWLETPLVASLSDAKDLLGDVNPTQSYALLALPPVRAEVLRRLSESPPKSTQSVGVSAFHLWTGQSPSSSFEWRAAYAAEVLALLLFAPTDDERAMSELHQLVHAVARVYGLEEPPSLGRGTLHSLSESKTAESVGPVLNTTDKLCLVWIASRAPFSGHTQVPAHIVLYSIHDELLRDPARRRGKLKAIDRVWQAEGGWLRLLDHTPDPSSTLYPHLCNDWPAFVRRLRETRMNLHLTRDSLDSDVFHDLSDSWERAGQRIYMGLTVTDTATDLLVWTTLMAHAPVEDGDDGDDHHHALFMAWDKMLATRPLPTLALGVIFSRPYKADWYEYLGRPDYPTPTDIPFHVLLQISPHSVDDMDTLVKRYREVVVNRLTAPTSSSSSSRVSAMALPTRAELELQFLTQTNRSGAKPLQRAPSLD